MFYFLMGVMGAGSWIRCFGFSILVSVDIFPFLHAALEECRFGNFILVSSIGDGLFHWEPGSR